MADLGRALPSCKGIIRPQNRVLSHNTAFNSTNPSTMRRDVGFVAALLFVSLVAGQNLTLYANKDKGPPDAAGV